MAYKNYSISKRDTMKQAIYQFLKKIPQGKVISYKTMAEYFDTSPRAIGKIMHSNKESENFPCYKVVRSDGKLGGYNGGIEEKIKKLSDEDIEITNNRIPTKHFRYPKNPSLKTKKK